MTSPRRWQRAPGCFGAPAIPWPLGGCSVKPAISSPNSARATNRPWSRTRSANWIAALHCRATTTCVLSAPRPGRRAPIDGRFPSQNFRGAFKMPALDRLDDLVAAENPYTNGGINDMDIYLLAQSGNPGLPAADPGLAEARARSQI